MYNKKIKFIILILSIPILLITLTGCGSLKSSRGIKKYIKSEYNIDVEVIQVEEGKTETNDGRKEKYKKYKTYTLKEKNRDITFTCTNKFVSVGMDGSTFWYQPDIIDNYYAELTESIQPEILKIESKYNVKFDTLGMLIYKVTVSVSNESEIDFDNVLKAINELMEAYNLKKKPSEVLTDRISIYMNEEYTHYYCEYTINGEKTQLNNSENDFKQKWEIPDRLGKDALDYINSLYDGNCYIVDTHIGNEYNYETKTYENLICYVIKNDVLKIREEYRFYLDRYKEDYKNNKLENMGNYLNNQLKIVYY